MGDEARAPVTPTAHRKPVKARTPLTDSAKRLRDRCLTEALARRASIVAARREEAARVPVAAIVRTAAESAEEPEDDDMLRYIEQYVEEELARRDARDVFAHYEDQARYEEEELAALLETHLGVQDDRAGPEGLPAAVEPGR
mmetsp:Transcript_13785/g.46588  ORF Transcript_13785/g.46588 Transcript_13785/m.46588 type:complete len:142 (-) Transcript_13785:258-683(-)